jgi:hypothetical protein
MTGVTLALGVLLVAVGVGSFGLSETHAPTALIPAVLGVLFCVCAAVARNPKARMHAIHAAVLLGLVGLVASLPGLLHLPALLSGQPVARPLAVAARSITAGLCLVYLVLAVRSFIQARRARLAGAGGPVGRST